MKNKLLCSTASLALLGLASAAHAQSSVTLYGVIDESVSYINHANGAANEWALGNSSNGNLAGSRWGLKGNEDLGSGLKAIFTLESGFNPSTGAASTAGTSTRIFNRQAFVGLQSDNYGTLTLGRQYDATVDLVQGITEDNYFGSAFATAGDVDNYDNSFRVNNSVKYLSPSFAGLQFEGTYSLGGVAGSTGSQQTYSGGVAYANGPFAVAAAYFQTYNANSALTRTVSAANPGWTSTSDGTFDGPINIGYATAHSIGVARIAGQYVFGPFTAGLGYSNARYTNDGASVFTSTQKYNTGQGFVNYQATPAMLLGVGYSYTKANGDTSATYNQVSLGADYNLSKRTDVYMTAAYQHANGQTRVVNSAGTGTTVTAAQASIGSYGYNGTSSQTLVNIGLRHKF